MFTNKRKTKHNSTYKKLAVLWLNEALCFVSSFVVADSLVLRNRHLRVAAKRYPPLQTNLGSANTCVLPFPEGILPHALGSTALKAPNKRTADNMGSTPAKR
jgi:hypothetical protein